jgi:hypothetical protein
MHKLKKEIMCLKIQINSSYGVSGGISLSLYGEMLRKKDKFSKIQNRVLKIKRIFDGR